MPRTLKPILSILPQILALMDEGLTNSEISARITVRVKGKHGPQPLPTPYLTLARQEWQERRRLDAVRAGKAASAALKHAESARHGGKASDPPGGVQVHADSPKRHDPSELAAAKKPPGKKALAGGGEGGPPRGGPGAPGTAPGTAPGPGRRRGPRTFADKLRAGLRLRVPARDRVSLVAELARDEDPKVRLQALTLLDKWDGITAERDDPGSAAPYRGPLFVLPSGTRGPAVDPPADVRTAMLRGAVDIPDPGEPVPAPAPEPDPGPLGGPPDGPAEGPPGAEPAP